MNPVTPTYGWDMVILLRGRGERTCYIEAKFCFSVNLMPHLVLVRHGESRWNVCNRFTGWVDVPLSENGIREAELCAKHCKRFAFSSAFTSSLERAHETLHIILSQQDRTGIVQHTEDKRYRHWLHKSNHCDKGDIPVFENRALNERYYGKIQGMDKLDAEKKYGKVAVHGWRRGYVEKPPGGESLKEAFERTYPYFTKQIVPRLKKGETVLLAGHGNTLRALMKKLEGISDHEIAHLDLPEAEPIVYAYRKGTFVREKGEYSLERPLR